MGPHPDPVMAELRAWKRQHPQVIIKSPEEVPSHLWEVTLPRSATMAFDSPEGMLRALRMTSIPEDE